jgi:hypothetical protein
MSERLAGLDESSARKAALAAASAISGANCEGAGLRLEFGSRGASGQFSPSGAASTATAVRATVFRNGDATGGPVPLLFSALWGRHSCAAAASATSEIGTAITAVHRGLMPFAVPQHRLVPPGGEIVFYPADGAEYDEIADKTVTPGCFGLLNLDGGDLATDEITRWIADGYDQTVGIVPAVGYLWIDGTSGFRAAIQKPMRDKIGQTVIICIYDQLTGTGSGAQFRCVGFVLGTLLECRLTGGSPLIRLRVDNVTDLHGLTVGPGLPSPNIRKIQLVD